MQIDKFIATRYKWTKSTKTTARKHLEYWQEMTNGKGIEEVTIEDFETWRESSSDSMRYTSMWAIKAYLKWAKLKNHPLLKHSVKRQKPPQGIYVTLDQALKLIDACDTSTPKGLQDACIVAFLWETWSGADGLLSVTLNRLRLADHEVDMLHRGQGWHTSGFGFDLRDLFERWLPVRTRIARCQHLFINIRRGTPLTYGGLRSILDNLGEKTGIFTTPHQYRRGGAKYFADNGGEDSEGMSQGGWKSHAMYRHYTGSASIKGFKNKRWMNKKDD
jgi:integrase